MEIDSELVPVRVALKERVLVAETEGERLLEGLLVIVGETDPEREVVVDAVVVRVVVIVRVVV